MKMQMLIIGIVMFYSSSMAQNTNSDEEAIKNVIQTAYVEGLQNEGDIKKIDSGFHPDFELLGIGKDNEMWRLSITNWKKSVEKNLKEGKLPKKGKDKVSVKFLSVDVTGTVAVAKFEFYVGDKLTYIDYQSLYKFPAGWKIVSKVFYKF